MNCRQATKSFLDVELGLAGEETRVAFESHVAGCVACTARVAAERRLTTQLEQLRLETPVEVDLTARVVARVARTAPALREEPSVWQLAWSAGGLVAFLVALLFGLWRLVPAVSVLAGESRTLVTGLWRTLSGLAAPLTALVSTLARMLGGMLRSLAALAQHLQSLEPLIITTVVLCTLTMATCIILVVGRDIRRPRLLEEEPR